MDPDAPLTRAGPSALAVLALAAPDRTSSQRICGLNPGGEHGEDGHLRCGPCSAPGIPLTIVVQALARFFLGSRSNHRQLTSQGMSILNPTQLLDT
jgi:hypothetical protein